MYAVSPAKLRVVGKKAHVIHLGCGLGPNVGKAETLHHIACRLIETAMGEYAELLAEGDSAAVTGREITRQWNWLDIAAFAVPVLVILIGFLA